MEKITKEELLEKLKNCKNLNEEELKKIVGGGHELPIVAQCMGECVYGHTDTDTDIDTMNWACMGECINRKLRERRK